MDAIERLYFEHPHVCALADIDPQGGGRGLHAVCEGPSAAAYAAQLAARLNAARQPRPESRAAL